MKIFTFKQLILSVLMLVFLQVSFAQKSTEIAKAETYLNQKGEVYFTFKVSDKSQINNLSKIISIDNIKGGNVYAYANKKEFNKFLSNNIDFTVLKHPGENPDAKMYSDTKQKYDWNSYPTYSAYETMMYKFQTDYPSLCKIYAIDTLASTRKLLVAKISSNATQDLGKVKFFYSSTMHGDETTGYILMLRLIDYLLTNYATNARVKNIVDNMEIWINPNANPDGTYKGGNNTVSGATRYNNNYVDINRNFKDPNGGDHPDGEVWQEETKAFMKFAREHHFTMAANFHGGIELANYPFDTWTSSQKTHADDNWWQMISRKYADSAQIFGASAGLSSYFTGENNGITNGGDWYVVEGGRQDFSNYFTLCREVTLEISDTKNPSASNLSKYWNANFSSIMNYIEEANYGISGIITDSITGLPLRAKVWVNSHDRDSSHIYSQAVSGLYNRPIKAGTYSLTFSAPGYVSKTITNIVAVDKQKKTLNVQLKPVNTLVANFTANKTNIIQGDSINFTDNSTGGATSWTWTFNGGNPSTSNLQNPTNIKYNTPGNYSVTLKIEKPGFTKTITKTNYITVAVNPFVNENSTKLNAIIYPNPNNGEFTVTINNKISNNASIKVFSILGKIVYSDYIELNNNNFINLNLSHLEEGIYYITLNSNNNIISKKIIITK